MGLPLAGKTTWIKENGPTGVLISADELKEKHPDYDPEQSHLLHEWSVHRAEELLNSVVEGGGDLVFDSGSINNSYTKRIIGTLKESGYYIKLVHIKTPYQVCLERNKLRTRKVPEQEIIHKAIRENAQFYKLSELVDRVEVVPYFTNRHIFIDMDGVIAALGTLPIIDGEIDFVNGEVHRYLHPVGPILSKLKNLVFEGYELYILSATPTSISLDEKNEWLDKHFNISPERRFFVNRGIYKAEMLRGLIQKLKLKPKDVLMLDDLHDTLYKVKDAGMNSMHPSEFLIHKF